MGRLQQKKSDQEKREKRKKIQEEKQLQNNQTEKKKSVPAKKPVKVTIAAGKKTFFHRSVDFVKEARGELKRVVWPGRKQTVASTIMVVVLVIIISSFLGLADFILSGLMSLILRS